MSSAGAVLSSLGGRLLDALGRFRLSPVALRLARAAAESRAAALRLYDVASVTLRAVIASIGLPLRHGFRLLGPKSRGLMMLSAMLAAGSGCKRKAVDDAKPYVVSDTKSDVEEQNLRALVLPLLKK